MENVVIYKYRKGVREVFPAHKMVNNWIFTQDEEEEAVLCNSMAIVAEKSGVSATEMHHMFPIVLRMLYNKSSWSGIKEEVKE